MNRTSVQEDRLDGWVHVRQAEALKVIIVGGGIGGMAAAIALRQQGHDVQIFESSAFSREVGAAMHLPPNGNAVLKRLGISDDEIEANVAEWLSEWTFTGNMVKRHDLVANTKAYEYKWRLAHRVKLHDALRKAAIGEAGSGRPVRLYLSKLVKDVDTVNAIVYFKDGTSVQGDVIIGADGVHSLTRSKLPGGDIQPFPSGLSAFRFLVPRETILSDPQTRGFADIDGNMHGMFGPDRSIIIYPTCDNTLLNFVCIHPDVESGATGTWGSPVALSKLLSVYKEFHPDMLALLEKADESSLRVWKLLDMQPLPNWCDNRLTVIGDAAHPFMPFLGQGGSIAIEDAVAVGVILEQGTTKEEIPERLKLYQKARKERAELVQHYTRLSGKSRGEKTSFDVAKYQGYCFGYNEWDNAAQVLREWKWSRLAKSEYQMTSIFGPARSLQQMHQGQSISTVARSYTTAIIKFHTSRTVLDGLLPPGNSCLRFKSSASIAQCTFRQTSFRGLPRLGGRGYNHLSLYIHGIEYENEAGQTVTGAFLPIMFENMADTITAGREELGVPKVWSTIEIEQDRTSYHIRTGWEGLTWGNFVLEGLQPLEPSISATAPSAVPDASENEQGVLLHRYTPQVDSGSQDISKSERIIFVPRRNYTKNETIAEDSFSGNGEAKTSLDKDLGSSHQKIWLAESAHFNLNARDWDAFPTLHHIISRLQEMPILGVIEAKVVEGSGTPELV